MKIENNKTKKTLGRTRKAILVISCLKDSRGNKLQSFFCLMSEHKIPEALLARSYVTSY